MIIFLLIPLFTVLCGVILYMHNGKREFLKLDLVQFVYAFVIAPVLYIWLKTFLSYLVSEELGLNRGEIFFIDSAFSVLFLYIYAFVVLHSLTKSFKMRLLKDPLHDLFKHSEYFHLWLSHISMFGGTIALVTILSLLTLFIPFALPTNIVLLFGLIVVGIVGGVQLFIIVWPPDPQQGNFMRLMKVLFGISFLAQVIGLHVVNPSFNTNYGFLWVSISLFATLVACSLVLQRSVRATAFIHQLKDYRWGFNIDVLSKKK